MIVPEPGSTVSHYALRHSADARTAQAAAGEDGARPFLAPRSIPDRSGLARMQARLWADADLRFAVAWIMQAWRLGNIPPHLRLDVLRGIDGALMKEL